MGQTDLILGHLYAILRKSTWLMTPSLWLTILNLLLISTCHICGRYGLSPYAFAAVLVVANNESDALQVVFRQSVGQEAISLVHTNVKNAKNMYALVHAMLYVPLTAVLVLWKKYIDFDFSNVNRIYSRSGWTRREVTSAGAYLTTASPNDAIYLRYHCRDSYPLTPIIFLLLEITSDSIRNVSCPPFTGMQCCDSRQLGPHT